MGVISIKNKLEVFPNWEIHIPGCEPISSLSSLGLQRELKCKSATISVYDAMQLIPGSKLVRVLIPSGTSSTGWFLELPAGPPPAGSSCPTNCLPDWYAVLRSHAKATERQQPSCEQPGFEPCPTSFDPSEHPRKEEIYSA